MSPDMHAYIKQIEMSRDAHILDVGSNTNTDDVLRTAYLNEFKAMADRYISLISESAP